MDYEKEMYKLVHKHTQVFRKLVDAMHKVGFSTEGASAKLDELDAQHVALEAEFQTEHKE